MALVSAGFAVLTAILAVGGFPNYPARRRDLPDARFLTGIVRLLSPPLAACRPPSYGKYLACTYVASLALT